MKKVIDSVRAALLEMAQIEEKKKMKICEDEMDEAMDPVNKKELKKEKKVIQLT